MLLTLCSTLLQKSKGGELQNLFDIQFHGSASVLRRAKMSLKLNIDFKYNFDFKFNLILCFKKCKSILIYVSQNNLQHLSFLF